MENEITVLVTTTYEELYKILLQKGFQIKEEFTMDDDYMILKTIDLNTLTILEILSKCIIIRHIPGVMKTLLYKKKIYTENKDILEQTKIECPVKDIKKAKEFMEAIHYQTLFSIHSKCIVYLNKNTELLVQIMGDYLLIELESKSDYIDKEYKTLEEMKEELENYNLPYDKENYFVKKAEIVLQKKLQKNY